MENNEGFLEIFRMTYWKNWEAVAEGSAGGGDGLSGQASSDSKRGRSWGATSEA